MRERRHLLFNNKQRRLKGKSELILHYTEWPNRRRETAGGIENHNTITGNKTEGAFHNIYLAFDPSLNLWKKQLHCGGHAPLSRGRSVKAKQKAAAKCRLIFSSSVRD